MWVTGDPNPITVASIDYCKRDLLLHLNLNCFSAVHV